MVFPGLNRSYQAPYETKDELTWNEKGGFSGFNHSRELFPTTSALGKNDNMVFHDVNQPCRRRFSFWEFLSCPQGTVMGPFLGRGFTVVKSLASKPAHVQHESNDHNR